MVATENRLDCSLLSMNQAREGIFEHLALLGIQPICVCKSAALFRMLLLPLGVAGTLAHFFHHSQAPQQHRSLARGQCCSAHVAWSASCVCKTVWALSHRTVCRTFAGSGASMNIMHGCLRPCLVFVIDWHKSASALAAVGHMLLPRLQTLMAFDYQAGSALQCIPCVAGNPACCCAFVLACTTFVTPASACSELLPGHHCWEASGLMPAGRVDKGLQECLASVQLDSANEARKCLHALEPYWLRFRICGGVHTHPS